MAKQTRERWIVLSNCQSEGLARSITALADRVDCDSCDVWQMGDRLAGDPDYFRRYDFALVLPDALAFPGFPADRLPLSAYVPMFQFTGYHPDCCYVRAEGDYIYDGFIGPYHSMIALAGYKEQISAAETARWFNDTLYQAAGYYFQWEAQRDAMIARFASHGFEIGGIFRRPSRGRSFMHTIDHPDIMLMMELARVILRRFDRRCHADAPPPVDSLAMMSWPVYPEIGEQLGVAGAYRFRTANLYGAIGLEDYLEEAFARFGRWDRSVLRVDLEIQPRLQHIRKLIREG